MKPRRLSSGASMSAILTFIQPERAAAADAGYALAIAAEREYRGQYVRARRSDREHQHAE